MRATVRRRLATTLVALLALGLVAPPHPGAAQEAEGEADAPAAVADEYLRGIEAGAWRATAQRIHPRALERLRSTLRILTEPASGDRLLEELSGGRPAQEYFSLDGGSLFVSVMEALTRESPGIINAMTDRDTRVLGAVSEGDSLRHAVYRLHWRLSGAEPEIQTLTLARDDRGRWRVLAAPELESLRPALRGLIVERPPPEARP